MTFPCVVFLIPSELSTIIAQYQDDAYYSSLFDQDGNLKVQVPVAVKYAPLFEGTDTKYVYGTQLVGGQRGSFVSVGIKGYGFELELRDGRDAINAILRALINDAYSDPRVPKDILVHDYVETEGNILGYQPRAGKLSGLKKNAGVKRITREGRVRTLTPGIRFQFMERDRRFIGQ